MYQQVKNLKKINNLQNFNDQNVLSGLKDESKNDELPNRLTKLKVREMCG